MAHRKRVSMSSTRSASPLVLSSSPNPEAEEWVRTWEKVEARELIDSPVISVAAETSVEEACELLLSKDVTCVAVNRPVGGSPHDPPFLGLFDFPDVNAFLTLAATRYRWGPHEFRERPLIEEIIIAAKAGRVPVRLISNLSEKNPLEILPHDATIISLLTIFSKGTHRVLVRSAPPSTDYLGVVSDRSLLEWFTTNTHKTPTLSYFLSKPLSSLALPSLYLYSAVVAAKASDTVLDAMRLMSDFGVSSVGVMEEEGGGLLSAVSVTDVGKIVVPSQSNQILSTPLKQFISRIKEPDGSTDGVDKYPVYSVSPSNTLLYTMQKILATNSHRLFVSDDSMPQSTSTAANLSGVVSIVDVLSLFARVANLPGVDPTAMQRHRRASSSSSTNSAHSSFARSRSNSRTGYAPKRLSVSSISPPATIRNAPLSPALSTSVSSLDSFQWAERVPK